MRRMHGHDQHRGDQTGDHNPGGRPPAFSRGRQFNLEKFQEPVFPRHRRNDASAAHGKGFDRVIGTVPGELFKVTTADKPMR
jgi:hypothetical protein